MADVGTPDEDITCTIDTTAHLEQRWQAIRCHRSQVPPFDAMDEPTQRAFLTRDHLRRV
jgi:N-acetyl-1-D-myo-inositol-2-amino-2-deoxy-alpha-D-glucopyranoside deacetylase